MDRQFGSPGPGLVEEAMQLDPRPRGGGGCHMVENACTAPAPPGGAREMTGQQPQPMEGERLFRLLTDQHWVSLDQVAANQNSSNQQIWNWVAQLLASQ